jgi:hypothetical protein
LDIQITLTLVIGSASVLLAMAIAPKVRCRVAKASRLFQMRPDLGRYRSQDFLWRHPEMRQKLADDGLYFAAIRLQVCGAFFSS